MQVTDLKLLPSIIGENVLHMAIVNEDPVMVKFLLDHGANFNEKAIGNFFIPEDQKPTTTDSLDHEWVDLSLKTDYKGWADFLYF